MREFFERDLQKLQDDILLLGSMVEDAIMESVKLLKKRDFDGSRRVIEADERINTRRFMIEDEILRLIATQQPMASDMRSLAAALEIVTELERIGDYAKGIANINLMIGEGALIKPLVDIPRMAEKSCDMLHRALDAFVRRDIELAKIIPEEDDEVDDLYNQVYRELITMITKNSDIIDQATHLLWVAHNLERTADRVVNICERTVFMVTGSMAEISATGGH
jgi:phosphate transport system protein